MKTATEHYVVCRREMGWGTGPGSGTQYPDSIQVMAASRTRRGAERAQKRLGGFVRRVDGPYRRYGMNEEIE